MRASLERRLRSRSPSLITSWYCAFFLSGRLVSTTPPTCTTPTHPPPTSSSHGQNEGGYVEVGKRECSLPTLSILALRRPDAMKRDSSLVVGHNPDKHHR